MEGTAAKYFAPRVLEDLPGRWVLGKLGGGEPTSQWDKWFWGGRALRELGGGRWHCFPGSSRQLAAVRADFSSYPNCG
jgi:hypothetical protein